MFSLKKYTMPFDSVLIDYAGLAVYNKVVIICKENMDAHFEVKKGGV